MVLGIHSLEDPLRISCTVYFYLKRFLNLSCLPYLFTPSIPSFVAGNVAQICSHAYFVWGIAILVFRHNTVKKMSNSLGHGTSFLHALAVGMLSTMATRIKTDISLGNSGLLSSTAKKRSTFFEVLSIPFQPFISGFFWYSM